ncbi:hypothetical protein BH10PSE13_BH10PSE13_15830 [soil metagenome]
MNFQTSHEYPTRPAEFINRSAEIASRLGGVMAFGLCLIGLLYLVTQ